RFVEGSDTMTKSNVQAIADLVSIDQRLAAGNEALAMWEENLCRMYEMTRGIRKMSPEQRTRQRTRVARLIGMYYNGEQDTPQYYEEFTALMESLLGPGGMERHPLP